MRKAIYFLLLLLPCAAFASGQAKSTGDSLYIAGDYAAAIEVYEGIGAGGTESHALYYNLGNAYYKSGNIAKAIINYERALLLSPGDEDTRFNLSLAKSKTVDKVQEPYTLFITEWVDALVNAFSLSGWAVTAIAAFIVLLLALIVYLFGKCVRVRKLAFFVAIMSLLVTVVANYAAAQQSERLTNRTAAIIIAPSITAKSTPDNSGTDLFVIHEGRKVQISDDTMNSWKEIKLEDGTVGWIPANALEKI